MARKKKKALQGRREDLANDPIRSESGSYSMAESGLQVLAIGLVIAAPLVPEGAAEQFPNWILFLLWLLACATCVGIKLLKKDFRIQAGRIDYCIYGVCGWIVCSGVYSLLLGTGHARPTINSAWQWLGYAIAFFVIRQLVSHRSFRIAAVWGLLCISTGISAAGLYQRFVTFPEMQRQYRSQTEEQKVQAMRLGGINNVEPGSRERIMWENRLNATDPTATFVLANSLAAFLTPWLIVGIALTVNQIRTKEWIRMGSLGTILLIFTACLLLTNSRTSLLATVLGVVALVTVQFAGRLKQVIYRIAAVGIAILVLVLSIALVTGNLDKLDLSGVNKSLQYRVEYWQASGELIRDHFWFGCGPGNFQHTYARYQLPQASETVSDPHNFLVEVWSIGGTPAAIAMILGMFFWLLGACRSDSRADVLDSDPSTEVRQASEFQMSTQSLLTCGMVVAGIFGLISSLLSQSGSEMVGIAALLACGLSLLAAKFFPKKVSNEALIVSLGTFAIALSASGGIGFPSVAMTGILLVALSTSSPAERSGETASHRKVFSWQKFVLVVLLIGTVVVMFLFRATVYDPIRAAKQHLEVAEMEASNGRLQNAMEKIDLAIQADPHDGNFYFFKLQMAVGKFQFLPNNETIAEIEGLAEKSVTSRPNNSKVALESGKLILGLLHSSLSLSQNKQERLGKLSNKLFELASQRRPNDALHAAYLAFSYAKTGQIAKSAQAAARGLELDQINPHRDKDLSNGPFRIDGYRSQLSIEQELKAFRKSKLIQE